MLLRLVRGEVPKNVRQADGFLCHSKFSANRSLRPGAIGPKKLRIDLLRPYQVFQLFQARKRPVFKDLFRHVNPLEEIIELFCSPSGVPNAFETGQMLANFLEGNAVAPIILTGGSKTYTTARKHLDH